jgi:hypothetical protein
VPEDGPPVKDGVIKKGEKGKREKGEKGSKLEFALLQRLIEIRWCGLCYLGRKGLRLKVVILFALSPFHPNSYKEGRCVR